MKNPAERLLGGHAFGTLTDEERDELLAAALEDQDLFDTLADQGPLRELMADRAVRNELLEALERPSFMERVRAVLRRPATWADLAAATATMLVVVGLTHLLWPRAVQAPRIAAARPAVLRALFELPVQRGVGADLRVEADRIVFRVEQDAQVIVPAQEPDGLITQVFPPAGGGARVEAGVAVSVARPGSVARIRLVVFAPDVDLQTLDAGTLATLRALTVMEWKRGDAPGGKTQ